VGACFGLPRPADHFVADDTRLKQFGFLAEAFCFFSETLFKGLDLLETALLHGAAPSSVMEAANHKLTRNEVLF
jgi:hypothetical protein